MRHILLSLALMLAAAFAAPRASADLIITEIVTDPQSDHSENSGGNATPYDSVPGNGTVSSVDEFLELYNAGPGTLDLTGYSISLQDTTPSTYTFGTTTSGTLLFSGSGSTTSLAPGEFVLLGNPPGAMNNTGEILLYDSSGDLIESFAILDGNATSVLNESVARIWSGSEFVFGTGRDRITPLAPTNPIPEPSGLALGALTLLAAYRASARTARHAVRRRRRGGPRAGPCPRRGCVAGPGCRGHRRFRGGNA